MMRRRPSRITQSFQEGGFVRQGRGGITVTAGLLSSGLPMNAAARFTVASTTFCLTPTEHLQNHHNRRPSSIASSAGVIRQGLSRSPKVLQQLSEPEVFRCHAGLAARLLRRQRQNPGHGIAS
jgi:hypothetical protein